MKKAENEKSEYLAPSLIKLGDVNQKTLGGNLWQYDNNSHSSACMDNGAAHLNDPCHQEYFS